MAAGLERLPLDLLAPQLARELGHDPAHDLARQAGASIGDAEDRADDLFGAGALHEVADRSRAEHLQDRGPVFERRERDHPRIGRDALDLPRGARAAPGGHLHVDEGHVGALTRCEIDGFIGVRGSADEQDVVLLGEEVGEGAAERGFVVGDEDTDARAHTVSRCRGPEGDHEPRR